MNDNITYDLSQWVSKYPNDYVCILSYNEFHIKFIILDEYELRELQEYLGKEQTGIKTVWKLQQEGRTPVKWYNSLPDYKKDSIPRGVMVANVTMN